LGCVVKFLFSRSSLPIGFDRLGSFPSNPAGDVGASTTVSLRALWILSPFFLVEGETLNSLTSAPLALSHDHHPGPIRRPPRPSSGFFLGFKSVLPFVLSAFLRL